MTDKSAGDGSSRIEDEIHAYREAEKKPKRNNQVIIFVTILIIIGALTGGFLITTNQNMSTNSEFDTSAIDPGLAASLKPLEARLAKDSKDVKALIDVGTLYFEAGSYREAIRSLEKAREIEPENTDALIALGMSLHAAGRRDEAAPLYEEALSIDPGNSFAKVRKAYLLADEDKTKEALELLRQVETEEQNPELKQAATKAIADIENPSQ